ncbi:hypothetical protein [Brevundimonas sp.]
MRAPLALALLTAVSLTGCDLINAPPRPAEPGDTPTSTASNAFSHSQSDDISGYYRPTGLAPGDLALSQVFVGQTQDFEAWEAGRRTPGFAPVTMEFTVANTTIRVLPDRYSVSDDRISMQGTAPGVGAVTLDARLDKGALATARRNLGGSEAASMTGTVRVGRQTVSGVKFSWYGGD